ncbi:hypothetical protein SO802_023676 [Lithocarpus litseifolius]|uniref:Uncharacterized protein n=1 Tax=Lithocarpus litseifolius TaxID=425828 RepID=A0AAW2C8D1_9ROSI
MEQDDTKHIKKVSKIVLIEEDCNVHSTPLTQSNQKPGSKTPLPRNVASCVTPSSKPKVTRSQKCSPIVTSQAEVPKVKKRKEIKDSLQESRLDDDEDMNEFEPFTEMEKIICNYIFYKNFEKRSLTIFIFQESWSERLRYKLAASLVLSKNNDQRSRIVEIARNIPLQEYFRSLKD